MSRPNRAVPLYPLDIQQREVEFELAFAKRQHKGSKLLRWYFRVWPTAEISLYIVLATKDSQEITISTCL